MSDSNFKYLSNCPDAAQIWISTYVDYFQGKTVEQSTAVNVARFALSSDSRLLPKPQFRFNTCRIMQLILFDGGELDGAQRICMNAFIAKSYLL